MEDGDLPYSSIVNYKTVQEYRIHYENIYCSGPIKTFDGIEVRFRKRDFDHAFFESSNRDGTKNLFSTLRAERIDWISRVLQDSNAELFIGWNNKRKQLDISRRVAIVKYNYVVIIRLKSNYKANFVTAFVADSDSSINKIRRNPKWRNK